VNAELAGQCALVTGAASGLGRAIAHRLASVGAVLALVDLDRDRLEGVLKDSGASGVALVADLSNPDEATRVADEAWRELGGLDVLVNNAGVSGVGPPKPVAETPLPEWLQVQAVNVTAPFLLCKEIVPRMAERGRGVVVNVASMAAFLGLAGRGPYCASKSALVGLTRALALEVAERGVRVNAVCPGWIDTPFIGARMSDPAVRAAAQSQVPLGRLASPDEIADAAIFLMTSASRYMTGAALVLDGGLSLV